MIKRIALAAIVAAVAIAIGVAASGAQPRREAQPNPRYVARADFHADGIWIWEDPATRCEYVVVVNGIHGIDITPRMQRATSLAAGPDRQVCR